MTKMVRLLLCVSLFAFFASAAWAQGIFATLTGVVIDPSQSVVSGAKVTLRNIESGSARETVSNGEGFFTFASVAVGTYSLTIEASGFKTHTDDAIRLGVGERRTAHIPLAFGDS